MAQAFLATNPGCPFFFNVSGAVGVGGVNQAEDVALVSFVMRSAIKAVTNPETRAALSSVRQTSVCTPDLIASIRALQRSIGATQDGRFSVATNPSGVYNSGMTSGAWMICRLSATVRRAYSDVYPRFDKIPGCPPEVAAMVARCLIGAG